MNILFLVDPIAKLNLSTDTSLGLMQEGCYRGYQVYYATMEDLYIRKEVMVRASQVKVDLNKVPHYEEILIKELPVSYFDTCFIRVDPPVDEAYAGMLQVLSVAEDLDGSPRFVNPPAAVLKASEKIYGLRHDFGPDTIVCKDLKLAEQFLEEKGGKAVLKPSNNCQSRGVLLLNQDDPNWRTLIEMTLEQDQYILLQEFLPSVSSGDKRVFFIDGEVSGVISRVPQGSEFRCALGLGASLRVPELTPSELKMCECLGKTFLKDGLFFVGIDLIDGKLIEVNVTSPTLVRQLDTMTSRNMEGEIYDRLLQKIQ
jgi:glutathione synthase